MPEGVVILHGIFRTSRSMHGLAEFLKKHNYLVLNVSYPSTRLPIEEIVECIHPQIDTFARQVQGRMYFIGYSMGGLVIRAYLCKYMPDNMGRVVMIGTPNHGSEVADVLQRRWLYRTCYGPAGQQLITALPEAERLFGDVAYELGVIAGNRSLDPISSFIIGQPNDGKVSIRSTCLEGMKDHIVIPATHTFFPSNHTAWRLALNFMQNGEFTHRAVASARN